MQRNFSSKNIVDPSPEILYMAMAAELGELYKTYTIVKQNTNAFGIGVLCALCGGLWAITIALHSFPSLSPFYSIPGLILLLIGFCMAYWPRSYPHWNVYLWQHGFIYEKGQIHQVFRWEQIESVQRSPNPKIPFYRVCRKDGYKIKLTNAFLDITELGRILFAEHACASGQKTDMKQFDT